MEGNIVWILIVSVIGLVVVGTAAYFIVRFLKGSVKLHLDKRGFDSGESITGHFILNTKKEVIGNTLTVALIGTKHIDYHNEDDNRNRDRTIEIYNKQVMIEQGMTYSAGFSQKYDFEVATPASASHSQGSTSSETQTDGLSSKVNDVLNSSAFKMASSAMEHMSNKSISYSWLVEVRLDIDGVDIATTEKVFVNVDNLNL